MKPTLIWIVVIVIVVAGAVLVYQKGGEAPLDTIPTTDTNGEEVVHEEAYYTNATPDMIVITSPVPGETITSPLTVTGEARGMWYFEATFPISLVNWDGLIIAQGYATADGEWMSEDFVPFSGTLEFTPDTQVSKRAALIVQNSNASGLPEHDRAVEMTLFFE